MKRFVFLIVVSLLMALAVGVVSADVPGPADGGFSSAFRVQNLDATDNAVCHVSFRNAAGSEAPGSFTGAPIIPGDSLYVFTPQVTGLAPGMYSAVISCDREVAAVVNFSDNSSGASHSGISGSDAADTWYAPSIYNNYFNYYSNVVAQNASSGSIDITLKIYEAGVVAPVSTQTIPNVPAGASISFDQSTNTSLQQNKAYSAVIEGTGNVAAIVNIYGLGPANRQLYSYNPFAGGSEVAYAPVIMNNYFGYNTALTVQNVGAAATTVTVTYGTGHTENANIGPGASRVFLNFGTHTNLPSGTITGAKVQAAAGGQIVATVNESLSGAAYAASYSAAASGSKTVNAPIVMRSYFTYHSSVTCQNISGATQNITINYSNGQSTTVTGVANGSSAVFLQQFDTKIPTGFIGSAVMTSAGDMVCVINQSPNAAPGQDQLYAYDGIGQ
jgi:hypothetical protein